MPYQLPFIGHGFFQAWLSCLNLLGTLVILHFGKGNSSVLLKADRFTLFFSEHWWRGEGEKLLFIHKKSYREKGNDRFWPQRRPTLPIKINRQGSCVCRRTVGDPPQPPLTHWQLELTVSGTRTAFHLSTHVTQHQCRSERLSLSPLYFLVKVQDEEFNVSWGNLYPKAMRVTASVPQPLHPSVATSRGTFCLVPRSPNRFESNCQQLHPTD